MIERFVNAGEMRTTIVIKRKSAERDPDGYPVGDYITVARVKCKWINAHGSEVYTADRLGYMQPATLRLRYISSITEECVFFKQGEDIPYRIISIDNVEERCRWLEIKVTKKSLEGK